MSYEYDKKTGEIRISGWENGIAPSPHNHQGVADLKGVNITSIRGEASLNYNRVREDQPSLSGTGTFIATANQNFTFTGATLKLGTWVQVSSVTGAGAGITNTNYYQLISPASGSTYSLTANFNSTAIANTSTGTFSWQTVAMGVPVDYCVEAPIPGSGNTGFRYYILDAAGIIWVSGAGGSPGAFGTLDTTTVWSAINPQGTSTNAFDSGSTPAGSLATFYSTKTTAPVGELTKAWLCVFGTSNLYIFRTDDMSGWPSTTGSVPSHFDTLVYQNAVYPHKSYFGPDQVLYWTDGPNISLIQQLSGQSFDPTNSGTYTYKRLYFSTPPTDTTTRITGLPLGNGLSIVVGALSNTLYFFPSFVNSSTQYPTSFLWMPESNTQYLLQTNNYIVIFAGNKGNVYVTNGSSVVPLLSIPDYVAGAENFVQDPYFVWGGAAYIRGRVFCSIQDSTSSHTGNCGGIWSFVPSFSYYINQDVGLALRMEGTSSLYSTTGFNGSAPVVFGGLDKSAQAADGAQYVAAWSQTASGTTYNSIDFSGTQPITNSSAIIETDAIPVGTFLDKRTFSQAEVKFSSKLVSGESVTINYRTDLEASWATAGTVSSESFTPSGDGSDLSVIIQGVNFQKAQIIQLQLILNGTATTPSWIRIGEIYIR